MKTATLSLFILCGLACQAQNQKERVFHVTEFISGHLAYLNFQAEVNPQRKFSTTELKVGVCLIKPFSRHFELRSRIGYGIKFRRSPDILRTMPGKYEYLLALIYRSANKALATQDSDFLDIPIILHYKMLRNNLGIEVGFNYRDYGWFYNVESLNFDYGPLCNLTYAFNNFSVFCGYTMGLKRMMRGKVNYVDESNNLIVFTWSAKSNFVQLGIEYNLFKRLKEKGKQFPRIF